MVVLASLPRIALCAAMLFGQLNAAPLKQSEHELTPAEAEKAKLEKLKADDTTTVVLYTTITNKIVETTLKSLTTIYSTIVEPTNTIVVTVTPSPTTSSSKSTTTAAPPPPPKTTPKTTATSVKSSKTTAAPPPPTKSTKTTVVPPKSTPKTTSVASKKSTSESEKTTSTAKTSSTKKSSTKETATPTKSTEKSSTSSKKTTSTEKSASTSSKKTSTEASSSSKHKSTESSSKKTTSTKKSTVDTTHTTTSTVTVPASLSTALFSPSVVTTYVTVEPWTSIAPKPVTQPFHTVSSSIIAPTAAPSPVNPNAPHATLNLRIVNNMNKTNMHVYVTGTDTSGAFVMLANDGTFYTPTAGGGVPELITGDVALPLKNGSNGFTLPDYLNSGRIWFCEGYLNFSAVKTTYGVGLVEPTVDNTNDASRSVNWGFAELNYAYEGGLFANLSFVDFVGMPVGMSLTTHGSGTQAAPGMPAKAVHEICEKLANITAKDNYPWDKLCERDQDGNPLRALAPSSYLSINPDAFSGYFDDYAQQVWSHFTSNTLTMATQTSAGNVACTVNSGILNCAGDNRGYQMPTSADVFGCNTGPFSIQEGDNEIHQAIVPRLCAAFNRGTFLIEGGDVQPAVHPNDYYPPGYPNNIYSMVVHSTEIGGQGYAFPYDDVTPAFNLGVAGVVSAADVKLLTIALGG